MAIIYSYPPNSNILPTDILVCTSTVLVSGKPKNQTKSLSIANLSTYIITSPSNNLNQVLTNGNTSLLNAKIGELYLYDTANLNYGKISFEDGELNMYDYTGARIFTVSGSQSYLNFLNTNGIRANFDSSILTINRNYTLPDQSGTIALTSNLVSYVPYTGATGDINIGNNSIYTTGGAKLWDDGTVEGTTFQFAGKFSSYINTNATVFRNWTLPDASGTIALTSDIPTLQQVVNVGNTIAIPTTVAKGIDITLANQTSVFQNGISVTIPTQTGAFPTYSPAPDAFVANINGQTPGTLIGSVVGFLSNVAGEDNIGFFADLTTTAGSSRGFEVNSFDAHTGDYFVARKYVLGVESVLFKVTNNGNVVANSITTTIDSAISGLTIGKGGGSIATNTALGYNTLLANVIGFNNTAVGADVLQKNLGDDNTAIGRQALFNNTTGDGNVAIGVNALFNTIGGINNIGLGFNARALNAADTNSIVIGYNAVGVGSQSVVIGNTNILTTVLRGKVAIGTTVPKSNLHVVGLVEYATNALAIAGGLTIGAFYHTGGIVKVVI